MVFFLRTRSGAIYGRDVPSKLEPLHVDLDFSEALRHAVARENAVDVNEPVVEVDVDDHRRGATELDDIDVLPELDHLSISENAKADPQPSSSTPSLTSHYPRTSTHPDAPNASNAQKNNGSKRRKKEKRMDRVEAEAHAVKTATDMAGASINIDLDSSALPSKVGGYSAKTKYYRYRNKLYSLDELLAMGFRLVKWDGKSPRPIIDRFGNIIACLLGRPDDDSYVVDCTNAFDAILEVADEANFKKSQKCHKRGTFAAVNVGMIHGQGTLRPTHLLLGKLQPYMDRLRANKSVRRIMGFQSGALRVWAPKLYAYGKHVLKTVSDKTGLQPNFDCSIFPCVAFNFGRNVWTFLHQDLMNLAWFWCVVTALGDFDAEQGGHLVMWEAKLVVEFPHAASIAIPSATFTHSNIPVREGERRTSVTQFLPGGLARWVDNGCRTEKEMKAEDKKAYDEMQKKKAGRWAWGMSFWSKLSDIVKGD